jgi:hypothetical protein
MLPTAWARAFTRFPSAQRWLSLDDILTARFDRILYLDNDTFILGDIERLFRRFQGADLYAREEPTTRRSHIGYDSTYIDESIIRGLQRAEKVNPILPFNIGVVLMKRQVAQWLAQNVDLVFRYLMRFTSWLIKNSDVPDNEPFAIAAKELNLADASKGLKPLLYPSRNRWILDQFALWFTLAASSFKVGLFPLSSVLQADEFLSIGSRFREPHLIHYYSANSDYFIRWLSRFERSFARTRETRGK